MTREEAWQQALKQAIAHAEAVKDHGANQQRLLSGLYTGVIEVRRIMERNALRTNDLTQLIACALDCLAVGLYEAELRGEKPSYPPNVQ